ncbi:MAG: hypothetical protein ACFFCE_06625 [Promethearchaeota archaeon]
MQRLFLYESHNNTVSGNNINYNYRGIYIHGSSYYGTISNSNYI